MRRLRQRDLSFALLRAFTDNRQYTQQQKRNVRSLLHEAVADLLTRLLTTAGYVVLQRHAQMSISRGSTLLTSRSWRSLRLSGPPPMPPHLLTTRVSYVTLPTRKAMMEVEGKEGSGELNRGRGIMASADCKACGRTAATEAVSKAHRKQHCTVAVQPTPHSTEVSRAHAGITEFSTDFGGHTP